MGHTLVISSLKWREQVPQASSDGSILQFDFFFFEWNDSLIQYAAAAKSHQSCPILCDPIDDSPPGSRP